MNERAMKDDKAASKAAVQRQNLLDTFVLFYYLFIF